MSRRRTWRPAREWGKDLLYVVVGLPVALLLLWAAWLLVVEGSKLLAPVVGAG